MPLARISNGNTTAILDVEARTYQPMNGDKPATYKGKDGKEYVQNRITADVHLAPEAIKAVSAFLGIELLPDQDQDIDATGGISILRWGMKVGDRELLAPGVHSRKAYNEAETKRRELAKAAKAARGG